MDQKKRKFKIVFFEIQEEIFIFGKIWFFRGKIIPTSSFPSELLLFKIANFKKVITFDFEKW